MKDNDVNTSLPFAEDQPAGVRPANIPAPTKKALVEWIDARIRNGANQYKPFLRTRHGGISLFTLRHSIEQDTDQAVEFHNTMLLLAVDLWARDKSTLPGIERIQQ